MNADPRLTDALLRLHGRASEWLKKSSVEEEAAWREQARVLESEVACETDDLKREEMESSLRDLRKLLENRDNRLTDAYANLIFANGLTRIGARTESASLEAAAAPMFKTDDAVHRLGFRAFTYRINQARSGEPCRGPLPPELLALPPEHGQRELEVRATRYKFGRLRSSVFILEPSEEVDAFRNYVRWRTRIDRAIGSLYEIADPKELEQRARELLDKFKKPDNKLKVLRATLNLFPRLPPSFSRSLLETAYGFLGGLPPVGDLRKRDRERNKSFENMSNRNPLSEPYDAAKAAHDREFRDMHDLLERVTAMEVVARRAADGADAALLHCVIRVLVQTIEAQGGEDIFHIIPVLAGRCLQSLQRLRLRTELEQLLQRVTVLIQGQPQFAFRRGGEDEKRATSLRLLLNVAAGWLFLGRSDLAAPLTEQARRWLLAPMPNRLPIDVTELACRYIAALALSPVESALKGLDELFPGVGPLGDTFSTNSHFSLVRLRLIDAVVRAVVHLAHPEDDVDDYLAVSLN